MRAIETRKSSSDLGRLRPLHLWVLLPVCWWRSRSCGVRRWLMRISSLIRPVDLNSAAYTAQSHRKPTGKPPRTITPTKLIAQGPFWTPIPPSIDLPRLFPMQGNCDHRECRNKRRGLYLTPKTEIISSEKHKPISNFCRNWHY